MTNQKHFWLRDEKNNPVGCVVSKREGKDIRWAYSAVNPKDSWNWKSGLGIALQRLDGNTPYTYKVYFPTETAKINVKHTIMTELLSCSSEKARSSAAKWLTIHLAEPKEQQVQGEK